MENELILLDTDFLIEHLYNNQSATNIINQDLATSKKLPNHSPTRPSLFFLVRLNHD